MSDDDQSTGTTTPSPSPSPSGEGTTARVPPHPQLVSPILFVRGGVSSAIEDAGIVEVLAECLRVRPKIERASGSRWESAQGTIEFEDLHRAEKALATVDGHRFPGEDEPLRLFTRESGDDPRAAAKPRLFKLLPEEMTLGALFDVCRPYGPIQAIAVAPIQVQEATKAMTVTYYDEEHAIDATKELHLAEIGGDSVTVEVYGPSVVGRGTHLTPARGWSAPVSRGSYRGVGSRAVSWRATPSPSPALGQAWPASPASPIDQRIASWSARSSPHPEWMQRSFSSASPPPSGLSELLSPSRIVDYAGSTVDPCNLFIKNLDQATTTAKLHALFGRFGTIVSARVMENPVTKSSKEFGFVSFTRSEEAAAALEAMDGFCLPESGKRITVRLHEPKNVREGRARRLGNSSPGTFELEHSVRSLAVSVSSSSSSVSTPDRSRSPSRGAPDFSYSSADSSPDVSLKTPPPAPLASPSEPKISDHDRLVAAVSPLVDPGQVDEVVALLEGVRVLAEREYISSADELIFDGRQLPKKEQKLCLFNHLVLKSKVAGALEILSTTVEDEIERPPPARTTAAPPSAAPTAATLTPPVPKSLAALARLPAADIVILLPRCRSLGVQLAPEAMKSEIDAFVDGLEGKPVHEAKQQLGERMFKAIKATGIKGAPRYTIHLLDTEELRPLAHLMAYPAVLKEKVLQIPAQATK